MGITTQLNTESTPINVPKGGTGVSTFTTANGVLCSNTTATGSIVTAPPSTAGFVLTSNGASTIPSFQAVSTPVGGAVYARVPMTLVQFLGMRVTPFQVIAAQGVNTLIVPLSIVFELNMAGVAFAGGGNTGLYYGGTGPSVAFMAASLITAPTAGQIVNLPIDWFSSATQPNSYAKSTSVNTGLFVTNQTAPFTGGVGATVVINVIYSVMTTT